VAGTPTSPAGYGGDNGPATSALLSNPRGVFVDQFGNLFISDSDNHRIREVFGPNPPAGQLTGNIITVAGNGTPSFSGDGGPATAAAINQPRGNVFVDFNENIFIPDTQNQCIREVFGSNPPAGHTTGTIVTIAGSCGTLGAYSGDGGPAIAAKLHLPFEVMGDSFGNIFFPDNANHSVREISL
jgi:hypothetical protein